MEPHAQPAPALDRGPSPRATAAAAAAFIGLVSAGLLLHLGVRPLEFEEPRRALVALEMALRGNLLVPTTNGALYLNKPPVFNWLLLACMQLFGSRAEWVLRVPTVAAMLLMALVFWAVARRALGRATAATAAGFLLTFTTLLFYGTLYGEIDVFYALVVFLQALAIFVFEQRGRPAAMFALSYLAAAAGFLTKGMPSLPFQALTLLFWLVHARRWRWLLSWAHLLGLAVFAAAVGGYLAVYARYADPAPYLVKLLFDAAERTPGGHGLGRTLLQLLTFPLHLLALCLPWCIFAPGLLRRAAWARIRATPFLRFSVVFLAANIAPYWISPGNRPRYMFMFLPFLAALLAVGAEELGDRGWYARALRPLLATALTLGALAFAALPFTPWGGRIAPLWLWAAAGLLLAALAVGAWRARALRPQLGLALLALATARIGYDLFIPALRREQSPEVFYEEVAAALDREHRAEPVQLLGDRTERRYALPVVGRTFVLYEPEWFSFALSFHYTAARDELLRYADAVRPGRLYLAHAGFAVNAPHEVVHTFTAPGERRAEDLKLIRVRE